MAADHKPAEHPSHHRANPKEKREEAIRLFEDGKFEAALTACRETPIKTEIQFS